LLPAPLFQSHLGKLGVIDIHTPTWRGVFKERNWSTIIISRFPVIS
jgi:hypothetical protein